MTKIDQSLREIISLSKLALVINGGIALVLFVLESRFESFLGGSTLGYFLGSLALIANLHILGRGLAPVIHVGRGAGLAVTSILISMIFLGAMGFLVVKFLPTSLLGFAFSFASLLPVGFVYAYRVLMQEARENSLRTPG